MHAVSVKLKNFRRFSDFDCGFDRHFSLLVGPNGCGKTSLLRAIHMALTVLRQGNQAGYEPFTEKEVRHSDNTDPSGERWQTAMYPCWVRLAMSIPLVGLTVFGRERMPSADHLQISGDAETTIGFGFAANQSSRWFDPQSNEAIPLIARFGANKPTVASNPGTVQRPFDKKQDVWKLSDSDASTVQSLAQWFQYNELRKLQEGHEPIVYRQVRNAVLSAIHAIDIKYVVRDSALMVLHEGQGWRPLEQLSDGQLRLASIFCDLAMRCAALNSHLGEECIVKTPGIVTIDELACTCTQDGNVMSSPICVAFFQRSSSLPRHTRPSCCRQFLNSARSST